LPYCKFANPSSSHSGQSNGYEHPMASSSTGRLNGALVQPSTHFSVVSGGGSLGSRGKRRRGHLPKPATNILRAWFQEHLDEPYPTEQDKQTFISVTGLTMNQVCLCALLFFLL
jgi:hypothetical protein